MLKKIGPYRVDERLGVGGMGEVYKAYDDRLDRWVAIKRIRPDKEAAEDNRERFVREARATARLNHPGIVHVYDIFKDGESLCIVMEYLEGRTLDTMVMEGALKPAKVLKLGLEIAAGLAEAHTKGIIHRDLKVENIIINTEGNAKILDFGLAKPILSNELDPSLTSKGQLVGTSRAMSPEYVSGEEIDQRSDFFSLGVLLYETATGHSPFKAQNTLATLKQVMVHEQTPAAEINSEVPLELSHLIDRLLAKDPEDRPHSAQEIADELGLLMGQLSSGAITKPASAGSAISRRTDSYSTVTSAATATAVENFSYQRWLGFTAILVTILAGAIWLGLQRRSTQGLATDPESGHQKKDLIVVAQFENMTGDAMFDDSLDFAFRVGLEQSRLAEVLSKPQMETALLRMERESSTLVDRVLGIELCKREGARALITGSIDQIGGLYHLTGHVVDPQSGNTEFAITADATSSNGLVAAIEKISQAIRANLGESLANIRETPRLEKVTTENLGALKAYSLGVTKDLQPSIPFFQRAIELDPEFAMAYAKLGARLIYVDPDQAQAKNYLEKAWASRHRLTDSEQLYVQAWLARTHGKIDKEISIWKQLSELHPNDHLGFLNLGMAYWLFSYRYQEAASSFQDSRRLAAPEHWSQISRRLAYCQIALGDYEGAAANLREAETSGKESAWHPLSALMIAQDDYSGAHGQIEMGIRLDSDQVDAYLRLSQLLLDKGDFAGSLKATRVATTLATGQDLEYKILSSHLSATVILKLIGQQDEFERSLAMVNAQDVLEHALQSGNLPPFKLIAMITKLQILNSGMTAQIESLLFKLEELSSKSRHPIWLSYTHMLKGEALLSQNKPKEASLMLQVSSTDSFQSKETMARIQERLHNFDEAISAYQWIVERRGRAFVECFEDDCEITNVATWVFSHYHLGRLWELKGNQPEAIKHYQFLLDRWGEFPENIPLADVRERLAQLEASSFSASNRDQGL
jgi:serine/threonine protein kinase